MLEIFNELKPFFEDVYREISVREYAKEAKISPPTASKRLKEFEKEKLLIGNKKGVYIYFRAKREEQLFRQLSRLYWYCALQPLTEKMSQEISFRRIILFGSLSKAENTSDSDMDLFLGIEERKIDVSNIENAMKRKVQLHFIKSLKNKELMKNITLEGIIIR